MTENPKGGLGGLGGISGESKGSRRITRQPANLPVPYTHAPCDDLLAL